MENAPLGSSGGVAIVTDPSKINFMADQSRARLFFDEIFVSNGHEFAFLAKLINGGDSCAENGWRDYKEAAFIAHKNPDVAKEDVKKIWCENLSAFANTSGGVLVWGFHTNDKIPDRLSLAPDCEVLAERLRVLKNDATDPYVAGVEVVPIKSPDHPTAGFVVCYIPASTFAPHQAQWGERTYFIRSQDSNVPCPQPLLRNMFYPRLHSRLEPTIFMKAQARPGGNYSVYLDIHLRNAGPATAEVAIVQVSTVDVGSERLRVDNQWEEIARNLFKYRHPLPPELSPPHLIQISGDVVASSSSVKVVLRFFTHNTPAHHSVITFGFEEIRQSSRRGESLKKRGQSDPGEYVST